MNMKYTECDIVRELLPLYIEQKTGEESNELIAKHLPECEECQEIYRWMSADLLEQEARKEDPGADTENKKHIRNEEDTGNEKYIRNKKHSGNKKHFQRKRRIRLTYVRKCWLALGAALLIYVALLGGIVIYAFLYLTWGIL